MSQGFCLGAKIGEDSDPDQVQKFTTETANELAEIEAQYEGSCLMPP